jgi:hypothetical protein
MSRVITLHTFTMQVPHTTRIMMLLTDITITHIIVLVTLRILLTTSDHITVGLADKAIAEVMPTTTGADTTEHNMLVVLTIMGRRVNMSAHPTLLRITLGVMEVLEGLLDPVELLERAALEETLEPLVRAVSQGQEALRHPHNHKAAQVSVAAQAVEEVSL